LGLQSKTGGRLHPRLNTGRRPIANNYREGKMKSTLKREFKVREIAERETFGTIVVSRSVLSCVAHVAYSCGVCRVAHCGGESVAV